MRNRLINILSFGFLAFALTIISGCQPEEKAPESESPKKFMVEIPDAISAPLPAGGRLSSAQGDTLKGGELYYALRLYIYIGEQSAKLVEDIIIAIGKYNINKKMNVEFTSDDDGRRKILDVVEGATFEGKVYKFRANVFDKDSGLAMQIYWNTAPAEGTAILRPYLIDMTHNGKQKTAMYRVDYKSVGDAPYNSQMEVYLSNLAQENPTDNGYVKELHMFVGKYADTVEVKGVSIHPKLNITTDADYVNGTAYAFAARGTDPGTIGVAKLSLAPAPYPTTDSLFTKYSIYSVLYRYLLATYPTINTTDLSNLLNEARNPGYFSKTGGFLGAGPTPPAGQGFKSSFINLDPIQPKTPLTVKNQIVQFGN